MDFDLSSANDQLDLLDFDELAFFRCVTPQCQDIMYDLNNNDLINENLNQFSVFTANQENDEMIKFNDLTNVAENELSSQNVQLFQVDNQQMAAFDNESFTQNPNQISVDYIEYQDNSSLTNLDPIQVSLSDSSTSIASSTSIESKFSTVLKSKKKRKEICMNPNAVAARENRAKKKNETISLKNRLRELETENSVLKKLNTEFKDSLKSKQHRIVYLESILQNFPQIASIIDHMKTAPNLKLNSVNLHSDIGDNNTGDLIKECKGKFETLIGKEFSNLSSPGVCFHLKSTKEMSVRFCQYCNETVNADTEYG